MTDQGLPRGEPGARGHVRALDGMRAVAVVLVVAFHLRVPGFAAGYLGVDVFFVLSGFLITSLLLAELQRDGRIALMAFWSRRVRRLLPALALLLLVVAVVTAATATYTQRAAIRGDLLAATAYIANWRFIATSSYFVSTGIESPLQHTWSLAIEEQFYLVWPLVLAGLVAVFGRARRTVGALAVAGIMASAAAMALRYDPAAVERAYMGTDARIFEPLVGALGAVLIAGPAVRAWLRAHGGAVLATGALGLVAGLAMIRPDTAGYYRGGALLFSVATLLVVGPLWVGRTGAAGAAGAALGWRPIAWLGAISYGIYLWHWPLITWLGVREARGGHAIVLGAVAVALTVVVAALSYHLVERPIRTGRRLGAHTPDAGRLRRPGIALAATPLVLLLVASASIAATRVPPPADGVPVLMLVGDSVPLHLEVALDRSSEDRGWRMVSAAEGGCSVTGETATQADGDPVHEAASCARLTVPAQETLLQQDHPEVVLWWDRWSISDFLTARGEHVRSGTPRFWDLRGRALDAAVRRLTVGGAMVFFVATEPPGVGIRSRCTSLDCPAWDRFQIANYGAVTERWNAVMRSYAAAHPHRARYLSLTDAVCHDDAVPCDDRIDGVPARPDGTHYAGAGEDLVSGLIAQAIAPYMTPSGG